MESIKGKVAIAGPTREVLSKVFGRPRPEAEPQPAAEAAGD